jgi:hypothetical protein
LFFSSASSGRCVFVAELHNFYTAPVSTLYNTSGSEIKDKVTTRVEVLFSSDFMLFKIE